MFDVAWSELLLIGAVALIFIGPKELPGLLVNIGRWVRRARTLATEFQGSLDQALREAEIDALKQKINSAVQDAEKQMPAIDAPGFGMQIDSPALPSSSSQETSILLPPPPGGEPVQDDSSRGAPPSSPDLSPRL